MNKTNPNNKRIRLSMKIKLMIKMLLNLNAKLMVRNNIIVIKQTKSYIHSEFTI